MPTTTGSGYGHYLSRGGATNSFIYNGLDTRVSKVDSGGTKTFRRDGAYVTDSVLSDGSATYTPGVSERRSGNSKFAHLDYLGSLKEETNSGQGTSTTRSYDAFGNVLSTTGTVRTPFGFAGGWGYQEDGDSGLKLLGHRYYDSSTGRFLTRDPAYDGRNWYVYCGNSALKYVDPNGLQFNQHRPQPTTKPSPGGTTSPPLKGLFPGLWAWILLLPSNASAPPWTGMRPGYYNPLPDGAPIRHPYPPKPGYEWRGPGEPGTGPGSWYNPETGESLHPHPKDEGHEDHWDYVDPFGFEWRIDPVTGEMKPKLDKHGRPKKKQPKKKP